MDIEKLIQTLEELLSELKNADIEENLFTVEDVYNAIYRRDDK